MSERAPQSSMPAPRSMPLVLVGADGVEASRWLTGLLEDGGYAVLRERLAQHVLERARGTEPDIIIVDAELPDMAGVELCRSLRVLSTSTPILLSMREPAGRSQRLAALRAGAWECITPPHDGEEILVKIGVWVGAKLNADRTRAEGLLDSTTGLYNRHGLARRARELGSQAFRDHGSLACVVLTVDAEWPSLTDPARLAGTTVERCVQALRSAMRLSDVLGRLSPSEFAVLAPGTDGIGARRLAERLVSSMSSALPPPAAATPSPRFRCGYDAVANVGYAPIEPLDLLVHAAAAVRTGKADTGDWLRRFDEGLRSGAAAP